MLERLFDLITKATSVTPRYTPEHCLVVTKTVGGCNICAKTCPHDAITIDKEVEIDDIDCTGCGLCVQTCPSQALESKVSYQPGAPLKCSRVKGSVQTAHCLARLRPSDLLRLASSRDRVVLARGDCAACPIGTAAVVEELEGMIGEAQTLAALRERTISFEVAVTDRLDVGDAPDPVSRRELLRGGWRGLKRSAADALAPLDPGGDDTTLPTEMQQQYEAIKRSRPEPEELVPWTLPRVHDGCIMCPVCTNVCPTDAFHREFGAPGEGSTLKLEPERCMGCNACAESCPVRVITLDDVVTWGELSGGTLEAYHKDPKKGPEGSVSR